MKKTVVKYDKPIYLVMCILDLSKTLVCDFHYNYVKPKYGDKAKLLYTDTDSFTCKIGADDFYIDIAGDVETWFGISEFDADHPSGIQTGVNKKVIGMMKDEAGGKIIQEFVGLGPKQYSFKMWEDSSEHKRCKGIRENVVNNRVTRRIELLTTIIKTVY